MIQNLPRFDDLQLSSTYISIYHISYIYICISIYHICTYIHISYIHISNGYQWLVVTSFLIIKMGSVIEKIRKNPRRTRLYSTMGSKADCRRFFARRGRFELRRHRWQRCATAAPRAKAQRGPWRRPWPWSQLEEQSWENFNGKIMENHGKSTSSSGNGEMIETSEVPRTQKKKLISKWKTYQTKWY